MKRQIAILAVSCLSVGLTQSQPVLNSRTGSISPRANQDTKYQITERGGDYQIWQKTSYETLASGKQVAHTHQYTELATGLNYQQYGQWVATKEEIDIQPDGSAAATHGPHQAYFPGDIYNGEIELVTPDGKRMESRPMGLSYDDGSQTVLIAMLTNSAGELAGSNQVIYPDAFAGLKADLRYTYRKSGFEQDIVLREQPPAPEAYGLNPKTARLQVLTEFFNTPEPAATEGLADPKRGLQDNLLSFGQMKMGRGKAFSLAHPAHGVRPEIPVYKSWQHLEGRTFLVEELAYEQVAPQLKTLPQAAKSAGTSLSLTRSVLNKVSSRRLLTPQRWVQAGNKAVQLAKADADQAEGVVLDYVTINSGGSDYTFQGDTTYYVSGECDFSGNLTFEGGTVIKLDNSGQIDVTYSGGITCKTGPYRPAIFTSVNDDSVGETISGISSGTPAVGDVNTFLSVGTLGLTLHDMRFSYCNLGLNQLGGETYSTMSISDCQFTSVDIAILGGYVTLENVLFSGSQEDWAVEFSGVEENALNAENVTADGFSTFAQSLGYQGWWPSGWVPIVTLNNCLVTCYNIVDWGGYYGSLVTNATAFLPSPTSPVYQSAGGGNYYLADNTYRNAGTANISPQLLAALRQKTTYPPMVYSNTTIDYDLNLYQQTPRDSETPGPDLGYHYDPLDYALGDVIVTNATVTVSPGTVVGIFGVDNGYYSYGLSIGANAQLLCYGTAVSPNRIVTYNSVQESPGAGWQVPTIASLTDYLGGAGGLFDFRFTDWSLIGPPNVLHLLVAQSYPINLRDCRFQSGGLSTFLGPTINLTNNLFERVYLSLYPDDANTPVLANNLFYYGTLDLLPFGTWHAVVKDNLFDHATIVNNSVSYTYTGGYNAYVYGQNRMQPTYTNDFVLLAHGFPYQTGPLGNYYEPTNSQLINRGSQTVDDAGLTGYTILTNQAPDSGTVDIGYHYSTFSPPNAYNSSASTCPATANDVYLNASDSYSLPLAYIVLTSPTHGTLLNEGSGHFIYTPTSCYEGTDHFTFKVNDGIADSGTATVTLTTSDSISTSYSTSDSSFPAQTCKNTPLGITLNASDACGENPSTFTYTMLASPTNGVLLGTAPNLTYSNTSPTFTGRDRFTYKVSTICGNSATNTVAITVGDVNISANPQTAMTGTNQPFNLTLTASDNSDSCVASSFTYTITANPTNGTLSGTGANRTYTPHTNYEGIDHFTFNVSDGVWTSSPPATVTIFVVAGPQLVAQCPTNGAGILLNWSLDNKVQHMVANDGLTIAGFKIYRLNAPGLFTTNNIIYTVSDPSQTTYQDLNATPGDTYYYVVTFGYRDPATGIIYVSPYSNEATNTTCCPADSGNALWVEYGPTPLQLAQWIMGTNRVTVTNATYMGTNVAIGIFGNGSAVGLGSHLGLPIDEGVILSSGNITNAIGPNSDSFATTAFNDGHNYNGDPDLDKLVGGSGTEDAAVLEFDIVSTNSFTLQFQYIYASEEYPEFCGAEFNDPMAIFVSTNRVGTNWINSITNDLALVPGTTNMPVSVNNINGGCTDPAYSPVNSQYYVDNDDPGYSAATNAAAAPVYNLQYDGFTTLLTNHITISANVTNHVKIAIADFSDDQLDSAVFIKAQISCP